MLGLEFRDGIISLETYSRGNHLDTIFVMKCNECNICGDMITFFDKRKDMFTCMKSDIKIIGDLFDIPYGSLGEGWRV
jgi:hypothetical protein